MKVRVWYLSYSNMYVYIYMYIYNSRDERSYVTLLK